MIPDERRAALVEKVALALSNVERCGAQINGARVLCDDPRLAEDVMMPGGCFCRKQAPAALTVALEEAAMECEEVEAVFWEKWKNSGDMIDCGKVIAAETCAAAIRALIPESGA